MVLLNETENYFLFCIVTWALAAERLWVGFEDQRYGVSIPSSNSTDVTSFLQEIIKHTWTKFTGEKALLKLPVWYDNSAFIPGLQIMFLRKMWTNMSALPGDINGNVSTQFSDQIQKHLNLKTWGLRPRTGLVGPVSV